MPMEFNLRQGVGVYVTQGNVGYQEGLRVLAQGMDQLRASPQQPARVLFDIRLSTENRSAEEIRGIAQHLCAALPGAALALLVGAPLYFGLGRMFSAYAEAGGLNAAVFTDEHKALAWLASGGRQPAAGVTR